MGPMMTIDVAFRRNEFEWMETLFKTHEGDFFECTEEEGDKAILHRFVAAGAIGRYHIMEAKRMGPTP